MEKEDEEHYNLPEQIPLNSLLTDILKLKSLHTISRLQLDHTHPTQAHHRSYRQPPCVEEETDRRESKDRRCCLGDWNILIPCRTTDIAPGWFEEQDE